MNNKTPKRLLLFSMIVAVLIFTCIGYWIYQRSMLNVVHTATISFMEQIAEHDRQNMLNQMNSKWDVLETITNRVYNSREYSMSDVLSEMKLNVVLGTFQRLYLITDDMLVYSHTGLKNNLQDMAWREEYMGSEDTFATIYREDSREHWGEYMVCGKRLSDPVQCGGESIVGIVGLVPITTIAEQMRLESFEQLGMTVIMQPNGEIITASTFYDSKSSSNYLTFLSNACFKGDYSLDNVQTGITKAERQLFRFALDGKGFYTLIEPLNDNHNSGWYLIVQLSDEITTNQVQRLLMRSLFFFAIIGIAFLAVAIFVYWKINETKTLRIVEKTKTQFLANMSHEIRTPLNGISGLCFLMQEDMEDKEKLTEYLQKTVTLTTFLKDIINDVLDMSKIESGQLELVCKDVNLAELLSEVRELLETQAQDKHIDFTIEYQNLIQNWIVGDPIRIKQIFMNILGNAIKFTPEGGSVSLTSGQKLANGIVNTTFVIKDNGCGMSKEFLERIWQPFEQENRLTYKNGTGLGTTISKSLVEKMQGTISVESKPDQGTTFTIAIPFPVSEESGVAKDDVSQVNIEELKGRHVMVVEDNELNRMIITTVLKERGCILTEASNGKEAVDIFLASPEHSFDLILMDVQMPVMDGYEAVRKIRQSNHPDAKTVIIFAVTANAFQEDLDKVLEAGMNDAITKPLNIKKMLEKVSLIKTEGKVS